MVSNFYNENAPMPFAGLEEEEEPLFPGRKKRRMIFPGAALGPMGYMGQAYPFMLGPLPVDDYEEEDPNP